MLQGDTQIAEINDYFVSIQGEGLFIGVPQFFVRFCGCPLDCDYCDTIHDIANYRLNIKELNAKIPEWIHSVSFTGGEPLLHADFIKDFINTFDYNFFLETAGIMPDALKGVIHGIDIISMDLKPMADMFDRQIDFANIAVSKTLYFKIVVFDGVSNNEIIEYIEKFKSFSNNIMILQPESSEIFNNFRRCLEILPYILKIFPHTRIIPQVHKWLKIK